MRSRYTTQNSSWNSGTPPWSWSLYRSTNKGRMEAPYEKCSARFGDIGAAFFLLGLAYPFGRRRDGKTAHLAQIFRRYFIPAPQRKARDLSAGAFPVLCSVGLVRAFIVVRDVSNLHRHGHIIHLGLRGKRAAASAFFATGSITTLYDPLATLASCVGTTGTGAGIRRPTMTFFFQATRLSRLS